MALIFRNGHVYYYESFRRSGRVVTRYVASGERALIIAELNKQWRHELRRLRETTRSEKNARRERARQDRACWGERRARLNAVEQVLRDFCRSVEQAFGLAMLISGHYLHHREWRVRRTIKMREQIKEVSDALAKLFGPASKGDKKALKRYREFLATAEETLPAEIWKRYLDNLCVSFGGDPARTAFDAMLGFHCGTDLIQREMVERRLAALRAELAGENPSPLERLLVERVVACWLDVWVIDKAYYDFMNEQNRMIATGDHYQRARDRSHRRLLMATKALKTIREQVLPNLPRSVAQVSGGNRQKLVSIDGDTLALAVNSRDQARTIFQSEPDTSGRRINARRRKRGNSPRAIKVRMRDRCVSGLAS
jgi:hypothetical protein